MYLEALGALQDSWLGHAARSGGWSYAVTNALHVLGAALVVGPICVLDILLLRGLAERDGARLAVALAAAGLALQAVTGTVLLAADARALGTNPAFLAKAAFMLVGLANVAALHLRFGLPGSPAFVAGGVRVHAVVSLVAWIAVLLAGRMIAYV